MVIKFNFHKNTAQGSTVQTPKTVVMPLVLLTTYLLIYTSIYFIFAGVKDMYVNVMSNNKPTENILAPDSIFLPNKTSANIYNPSQ